MKSEHLLKNIIEVDMITINTSLTHMVIINPSLTHIVAINTSLTHMVMINPSLTHIVTINTSLAHMVMINPSLTHMVMINTSLTHMVMINPSLTHMVTINTSLTHMVTTSILFCIFSADDNDQSDEFRGEVNENDGSDVDVGGADIGFHGNVQGFGRYANFGGTNNNIRRVAHLGWPLFPRKSVFTLKSLSQCYNSNVTNFTNYVFAFC